MPYLTPDTRRKLKYLPQAGQAPHGAANLACWNWALTGFGPTQNNPDELFNYVSLGIAYTPGTAAAWYGTPANQNQLNALQNQWLPFSNAVNESPARLQALKQINTEITKLSITLNGLAFSTGATPYELVMHYDSNASNGDLHGPNYTHWWLRIDGGGTHNDGVEVFPGSPNLNIRRPEYDSGQNNCRVYLAQLHLGHVNIITNVLTAIIAAKHLTAVVHGPWTDTLKCAICGGTLVKGITRHHCRCCGRPVCASCSPSTRIALLNGRVPLGKGGGPAGPGPYRVCLYC